METIKSECESCGGTGLYSGMCEAKGTAVVCISCDGTGCYEIRYKPFERRKGKRGIKTVSRSRGRFIAGPIGSDGDTMTYAEFQKHKGGFYR
jgi:hypothetical protein